MGEGPTRERGRPARKLNLAYGPPRWPPTGSKTGFALSPTPPKGRVILEICTRLSRLPGLPWSFRPPASLQATAETAPGKSIEPFAKVLR